MFSEVTKQRLDESHQRQPRVNDPKRQRTRFQIIAAFGSCRDLCSLGCRSPKFRKHVIKPKASTKPSAFTSYNRKAPRLNHIYRNKNMTIGVLFPPRLRTSLVDEVPYDPAEVDTTLLNLFPAAPLQKSSSCPARDNVQMPRRHRRNVSFHNEVTVVEVERVPKSETKGVWWSFRDMDRFRLEASRSQQRRKRGMSRSKQSQKHARKVLVQQCASEELDGIPSDPATLGMIASDSSKKSREIAHRSAQKLEQEVLKEYGHQRNNSITSSNNSITTPMPLRAVHKSRNMVADYYWGAVVDAFTDTVTCGIGSKVAC